MQAAVIMTKTVVVKMFVSKSAYYALCISAVAVAPAMQWRREGDDMMEALMPFG